MIVIITICHTLDGINPQHYEARGLTVPQGNGDCVQKPEAKASSCYSKTFYLVGFYIF